MTHSKDITGLRAIAYEISSYLGEQPISVDNGGCERWEHWKPLAASILSLPALSALRPAADPKAEGLVEAPVLAKCQKPSSNCPNVKEVGGGFEGELYRCDVCGYSYFLDYEDMK